MLAIRDIAFVRYQARDLESMERFLGDFGMHRSARTDRALYMRGYGSAHHLHITELGDTNVPLGVGVFAQHASDLSDLARDSGNPVEDVQEPGGGRRVRLIDPDGFTIDVIHGQRELEPLPHRKPVHLNSAVSRTRVGSTVS